LRNNPPQNKTENLSKTNKFNNFKKANVKKILRDFLDARKFIRIFGTENLKNQEKFSCFKTESFDSAQNSENFDMLRKALLF